LWSAAAFLLLLAGSFTFASSSTDMAPTIKKPRKAVTIFSEQFRQEELRRQQMDGTTITTADLNKVASTAWKNLSTEEKSRYKRMEEKELEKYGDEPKEESAKPKRNTVKDKEEKENKDGSSSKSKVKKPKDPNAPKKPTTSFFVFSSQQRPLLKATQPELKVTEVAKEMGRLWKAMDDEDKAKYEAIAEQDKKRYQVEFAAYQKTLEN